MTSREISAEPSDFTQVFGYPWVLRRSAPGAGDEIGQALGGSQLEFFSISAGFEDFEEQFDLPAHRIPSHLFNGLVGSFDWQVGQ